MASTCPSCRADVSEGARFCAQCGGALAPETTTSSGDPLRDTLEAALGFQYRIVRLLGRGGMGAVYLAHDLALDREVAIKALPPDRSGAPEGRERFRREARTAARLTHPHIVPLHTFGETRGIVYFVMGYVRGESLGMRLRRGRMSASEARRVLGEVADALDHAHRQGVVHRDLKPDNVLLEDATGRALLADFGIAKAQGLDQTLTTTGSVVGTPHYMSPEQASGKGEVDGRSDLYSLGVVGYQMLAGARPFEGSSAGDLLAQHLTQPPPALGPRAGRAPERLVSAIERCLEKDPAERWPDAGAFRQAVAEEPSGELPDELRLVHTLTTVWIAYGVGLWLYALYQLTAKGEITASWLLDPPYNVWIFLGMASAGVVYDARRKHHSWAAVRAAALRQPGWWRGYWPHPWRAAGDVWDRLPAAVRRWRAALFALLVLFWIAMPSSVIVLTGAAEQYARRGVQTIPLAKTLMGRGDVDVGRAVPFTLLGLALALGLAWNLARGAVGRRIREVGGVRDADAPRILLASTANRSFWTRPGIAALLEAPPGETSGDDASPPDSLAEVERSVSRRVARWPADRSTLAEAIVSSLGQCRRVLGELEREIASLRDDFDAEEARRLSAKVEALGPERDDEPQPRREMRALLARQLGLMRDVEARIAEREAERERHVAAAREVWRLTASGDGSSDSDAARLRQLCAELTGAPDEPTMTRGGA
jgi:serine/threonine protein kinase